MKLSGYGCSFIYGSELSSSADTWPALLSRDIGHEYCCRAQAGVGNLQIMEQILCSGRDDDILIINWTWIDRFDFVDCATERWETLRPALDHDHADYYFKNLHSQYKDVLTNLCYIDIALGFLLSNNKKFIMTYMDDLILEEILPTWHNPAAVSYLQQKISPHLSSFDGMNFLDWSRSKGFDISNSWHPLEQAHQAAAEYMLPTVRGLLHDS
jgi:hypothetical protein